MNLTQNDLHYSDRLCTTLKLSSEDEEYNYPNDIRGKIVKSISTNGIIRDFNIVGGQPFSERNLDFVQKIISSVRVAYPSIKITLQTNKSFDILIKSKDDRIREILKKINMLKIDNKIISLEDEVL